eukprot:1208611-Rhodomonas_salina.4
MDQFTMNCKASVVPTLLVNSDTVEHEVDRELCIMLNGGGDAWLNGDRSRESSLEDDYDGNDG